VGKAASLMIALAFQEAGEACAGPRGSHSLRANIDQPHRQGVQGMDGFTFNKIAGAVLGTVLFGFFVIEVSHFLYPSPNEAAHGEVMGYPVADAGHGDDHGNGGDVEAVEEPDLATLLVSADPGAGEAQFRACGSCHNIAAGASARVGPNLWGVVGRAVGGVSGFNYSGSMSGQGGTWTFDSLNAFLERPSDYVPGTSMSFRGVRRAGDRANLIAYLNQQSDSPLALPAPSAAPAPAVPVEIAEEGDTGEESEGEEDDGGH